MSLLLRKDGERTGQAGFIALESLRQPWVERFMLYRGRTIPVVSARLSAPELSRRSDFRVEWGPVRAADIPAWLAAGRVKDEAMRLVTFGFRERMAVAPVELVHAWPLVPAALILGGLYGLPLGHGWANRAMKACILVIGMIPVGTIAFPAIMPFLPGRAFAPKGALLGAIWAAACAALFHLPVLAGAGACLVSAAVVGFLAMNFTGASTFTCQPGALMEVEKGFWPMAASLGLGLAAVAASRFLGP